LASYNYPLQGLKHQVIVEPILHVTAMRPCMKSEDSEAPLVAHPAQRLFDLGGSLFLTQPAPRVQLVSQEVAMV